MTHHSDLGIRMKEYEKASSLTLMPRTPKVIRVDMRAGHSFCKKLIKPYDPVFCQAMQATAIALCQQVQGAVIGYVQSDEISIVINDCLNDKAVSCFFNGRIEKMVSLSASIATLEFNKAYADIVASLPKDEQERYRKNLWNAQFDSRVFSLPDIGEVHNYLVYRQNDAIRNSVQMIGHCHIPQREMQRLSNVEVKQHLLDMDISWDELPYYEKRGGCIIRDSIYVDGMDGEKVLRHKWQLHDMPLLTTDRFFVPVHYNREERYQSDYEAPLRLFRHIDELAQSHGVPSIAEHIINKDFEGENEETAVFRTVLDLVSVAGKEFHVSDERDYDADKVSFRFGGKYAWLPKEAKVSWTADIDDMGIDELALWATSVKMSQHGDLLLLKYDTKAMMSSPAFSRGKFDGDNRPPADLWHCFGGILREMRSVVIDMKRNEIVALPFYKFHNLGEGEEYRRDSVKKKITAARHCEITDKLDGSFCLVSYVGGGVAREDGLLVSSSGSIISGNAHVQMMNDEVNDVRNGKISIMASEHPGYTFVFEMIRHDLDPHVVLYPEEKWGMYLVGVRRQCDGYLLYSDEIRLLVDGYGVKVASRENLSFEDAIALCKQASAATTEGFVLDVDGWLVKMKGDEFVGVTNLVNQMDRGVTIFNTVIKAFSENKIDDIIPKLPERQQPQVQEIVDELCRIDDDIRSVIEQAVNKVPVDTDNRDAIQMFNDMLPKPFNNWAFSIFRGEEEPATYLKKAPFVENSALLTEAKFNELVKKLRSL